MKKYLFEEIPLAVPSDRAEMKSVFSKMLDDSSQSGCLSLRLENRKP